MTSDIFTVYLWSISGILTVICCVSIFNLFAFIRVKRTLDTHSLLPFVSVLVPARNEERSIRECIESLCNQVYPHYEVLVLDDDSTDSTLDILTELKSLYPDILNIVCSRKLPEGWIGKSYACHELSRQAKGDYLLFTDADTIHSPYALNSLIQSAQENQADLLTAVPDQILHSLWEHLMIPFMHVLYHGYLPNTFLYTKKNPAFVAANGQIMLFREECYHSIGGHEAVKSSLVEDIDIARALKKKGGKVVLANAVTIVSCSMYDGFNEVLRGFSKNFYPGFQEKTIPYIFFMLHVFTGYVLPLIVSIIAIITNAKQLLYVSLFALFLGMVIRSLSTIQFRLPLFHVLLQPFSALFAFIIGINSFLWSRPGKGRIWKERKYS